RTWLPTCTLATLATGSSGGGGGGSGSGGGGSGKGGGGSGGGGGGGTGGGSGGPGGGGGGSGGSGGSGGGGTGGGRSGPRRGGPGGGQRQQQQHRSETQSPQQLREWLVQRGTGGGSETCPYVIHTGVRAGQTCGKVHTEHRCFSRLDDTWSGVAIFDLDYDAIISAMYALSVSAEGDCYRCVPPDPGIATAALGASASGTPPGTAPAEALHIFTLDSGASRSFFHDSTTLTPLPAPVMVRLADPSGGPVVARSSTVLPCPAVSSGSLSGLHLPSFSMNLVSTAALHDAMVTTTTPGGQRVSICKCTQTRRHLATSGSRLLLVSPPIAPDSSVAPPPGSPLPATPSWHALPVSRLWSTQVFASPARPHQVQERAAPHSSSFPLTTAPLQTLYMDVWGPARVSGQGREHYILLVIYEYTRYTTVFPLRSKGQVPDVLIPWIRTVRLQLRERFGTDLLVLRLHSDRGGEFSSDLLRYVFRGEGILQSFTLPASPKKNGIVERRIGLVMEVARTSMIHAAAPHFLWPFAVRYVAHQLNLWPRVSLPETSPTLRWTGKVGDASVFRFYHPTSRGVLPSQDVTFDELVPFYRVSQVDSLPGTALVQVAVGSGAAPGAASGGAASGGAEPGGAGSEGAGCGGAEPGGAKPEGVEPRGAESEGAKSGGAERRAPGPGGAGDTRARGAAVTTRAGDTGGTAATSPGGARTSGAGAAGTGGVWCARAGDPTKPRAAGAGGSCAGDAGDGGAEVGGPGAGGAGAVGAGAVDPGAGGAGGTLLPRPRPPHCLLPLLTLSSPAVLQSVVSLRLVLSRVFALLVSLLVRVLLLSPTRTLWHTVRLRVPLPAPLECSLPEVLDPASDRARAASPTVSRFLATVVTDPSFESAAASALVAELLDFAAACHLDYATPLVIESVSAIPPSVGGECALGTDVLEDMQEDFECLAIAVPRFASMLLAPEGDPDIPTPCSYAEAITGPYSSQWVKRPPRSPPAFKARYVASELVGCLMYLMTCTRPDLAYPFILLACYVAPGRHRKVHWDAAKRVLRYLYSTLGMGLVLGGRGPIVLTGHADASWVDDSATQRSSHGYTFSLDSGSVSWRSTRSSSVFSSSCEAEIYAGAMAAQELRWLTYLLTDLGEQPRSPLRGQLHLAYVATRANTADVFTKALPPGDHQRFATVLGLVPTLPHLLTD
ncbi:unnamed protein product, partial [Closterium sp. NIES-53]